MATRPQRCSCVFTKLGASQVRLGVNFQKGGLSLSFHPWLLKRKMQLLRVITLSLSCPVGSLVPSVAQAGWLPSSATASFLQPREHATVVSQESAVSLKQNV